MDYQLLLLRIWYDSASKKDECRIVLQSVQTGEKVVLHSLEELVPTIHKWFADNESRQE